MMKKTSLRVILFLILVLQFVIPVSAMQQEILELRDDIRTITQRVQHDLNQHPNAPSVIVLGPTGNGKSTLVNLLAGRQFIAQQANIGFRVHTNNPLPGFDIQHQNIVGTVLPCSWYDQNNNTLFWDCPGFGDPRGAKAEIINAFSVHQLLKPNTKILLVAQEASLENDRATGFLKLLNELTALFPGNPYLKESLSVIISRQQNAHNIPGYLRDDILPLTQQQQVYIAPPVRELIQFLVTHPERISFFPRPVAPGQYAPNMQPIRQAVHATNYMINPNPNINVSNNSKLYVDALGKSLNDFIVDYMENQGNTSIINYCNHLIDSHLGGIEQLRTIFKNLTTNLKNLLLVVNAQNPNIFTQKLTFIFGNHFNVNVINQTLEHIHFFRGIRPNISYHTAEWTNKLLPTIRHIEQLSKSPTLDISNNILCIKGILIGSSDITTALQNHHYQQSNRIDVFSLSTLFLDENITKFGCSLNLISPTWKVIGQRIINLSGSVGFQGLNGGIGSDGKPGEPGSNGGHLFGKGRNFYGAQNLIVNTNGGNGGRGGDGGRGADGFPGVDGDLTKVTKSSKTQTLQYANTETWRDDMSSYDDKGSDGGRGKDGGKAGRGGIGGFVGTVLIEGTQWGNKVSNNGNVGNPGQPGAEGQGGRHGRHCKGYNSTHSLIGTTGKDRLGVYSASSEPPAYHNYRGYAPNGNSGIGLSNVYPRQPNQQIPFNKDDVINVYNVYYVEQSNLPRPNPFIRPSP
jgi:energy-coupling factor transporter ATP-binding protein EcfA2